MTKGKVQSEFFEITDIFKFIVYIITKPHFQELLNFRAKIWSLEIDLSRLLKMSKVS